MASLLGFSCESVGGRLYNSGYWIPLQPVEATDNAFWDQFWADTATSVQDVFALVPAAEIRAVREESPSNLATLCYKVRAVWHLTAASTLPSQSGVCSRAGHPFGASQPQVLEDQSLCLQFSLVVVGRGSNHGSHHLGELYLTFPHTTSLCFSCEVLQPPNRGFSVTNEVFKKI